MRNNLRGAASLTAVLVLSACASAESSVPTPGPASPALRTGPSLRPAEDLPLASSAPFALFTHCGVELTTIDGATWRTARRDDGQGNPPPGWPGVVRGTLTRAADHRAVFTSDEIPVTLVFRPAPGTTYLCD